MEGDQVNMVSSIGNNSETNKNPTNQIGNMLM